MNLQLLIEQYIAHRRSLGEQGSTGYVLRAFGRAVGAGADIADVRGEQVDAFLAGTGPITRTWHDKYNTLRVFYRYAVSRGYVATAPLPVVIPKRPPPFVPYIFSHEDLRRLLQAVDSVQRRRSSLEPVTVRTIVLLLYGAGLRVREAVNLNRVDIDLEGSLLTVHQSKFGKTRLLPFGPQLGNALAQYAARTRSSTADAPFFTTLTGGRVRVGTLQRNYRYLCERAGVRRADGARYQPRLHDLRHNADCRIMPTGVRRMTARSGESRGFFAA